MSNSITADQLADALDQFGQDIAVLSLDCFDTLIWRATQTPIDVFADLPEGSTLRCRVFAESMARQRKRISHRSNEVTLADIHQHLHPRGDGNRIAASIAGELEAEYRNCFAFRPTVDLIQRAKSRGLQVVIVSDTYLSSQQLSGLIEQAAGSDVAAMIDRIFVSCEHGASKAGGMFRTVLPQIGVPAAQVLHIGDNFAADCEAPSKLGINTLHFAQFPEWIEQQLRLESTATLLFDNATRANAALTQIHRAPMALHLAKTDDPARKLGFGTIGPVLHAFAAWVIDEAFDLRVEAGPQAGQIRPLFLLRDGHLPHQVFQTFEQAAGFDAERVEISRFAAFASSFIDEKSILDYLAEFGATQRFDALTRQLLFTGGEARALTALANASTLPLNAFVDEIRKPAQLRKIIDRSSAYGARLIRYLRQHARVEAGQTLMLVDLGYAGTVQDRVAPLLERSLGVTVVGRYLALRDVPDWRDNKRGLFSPEHYDYRTMDALCAYIALLEQLCTAEMSSVVDYSEAGVPIHKSSDMKRRQSLVRAQVQAACLDYADAFRGAFHQLPRGFDPDMLRRTAMGALSRLLFLPSEEELQLVEGFEHDVNMGVDDKVQLFDPDAARDGLLKRGLFYTNDNPRQYLPAEIRRHGMANSMMLMAQRRFNTDLRRKDFEQSTIHLPIFVADQSQVLKAGIDAHPTHDGYYMAAIPIGASKFSIGLNLGALFDWVQIYSLTVSAADTLMNAGDLQSETDVLGRAQCEGITIHSGGLLQCAGPDSFVFVPPPVMPANRNYLLTVVFRPVAFRTVIAGNEPAASAAATSQHPASQETQP